MVDPTGKTPETNTVSCRSPGILVSTACRGSGTIRRGSGCEGIEWGGYNGAQAFDEDKRGVVTLRTRVPIVTQAPSSSQEVTPRPGAQESREQAREDQVTGSSELGGLRECGRRNVLGLLRERGRRRWPLERVHSFVRPGPACSGLRARLLQKGAVTPGSPGKTLTACRWKRSRASLTRSPRALPVPPARRLTSEGMRTSVRSACPTWSDELLGEVIRLLLEAYDDPQFSDYSTRFPSRPGLRYRTAGRG